jgi:hypothetical protein
MPEFRPKKNLVKKLLPFAFILFAVLGFGAAFLLRSPVLIVTDASFRQLYGERRLRHTGIKTSLELFRRVVPVNVAETAGPDLAALAVEGYGQTPEAVFFSYRYMEAARLYKERHEETAVLVTGEGNEPPGEPAPFSFISTDIAVDLYRAGLCAALLAAEKQTLFLGGGELNKRELFLEGLKQGDYTGTPVFADVSSDFSDFSGLGCVVVNGDAAEILEAGLKENPAVPVLLFSWMDPAFCPRNVKLIFDDSPWALAKDALRNYSPQAGVILLASKPLLLRNKIEGKGVFRSLRACLSEKP